MAKRNAIPDFLTEGWRFVKRMDFRSVDFFGRRPITIGEYWFYIDERKGDLGYVIYDEKSRKLCIVWQKKIWIGQKQSFLSYLAYREGDKWVVRRLQTIASLVSVIKRNKEKRMNELTFFYDTITGEKHQFILDLNRL